MPAPWLVRVALVLLLFAPVVWSLAAKVPDVIEVPLTEERSGRDAVDLELSYADYPMSAGRHLARTILYLDNAGVLLRHDAIELLVANYATSPRLDYAEIAIAGTPCTFRTPEGTEYPNNATIRFVRRPECAAPGPGTATGQLHLSVRYSGPGRVALWTFRHDGKPRNPDIIYARDPGWSEAGLLLELRGRWIDDRGVSSYRRADLLNVMWEVSPASAWIWMAVGAALLLLVGGAVAIPASRASPLSVLRVTVAAFSLAAGLSILYVVLVPPFQAPDEPSHFGGYAITTGHPEVHDAASLWGYRMHFMRIHSHRNERFRPADVGRPYLASWDVSPLGLDRSSVTIRFWHAASPWLAPLSAQRQLLGLRLINAVFFSLAIATAALIVCLLAPVRQPAGIIAILLLAPTLPFFAMHVSNYAPVVASYMIFASAALVLVIGGPRSHWSGLPLGLSLAFAILCTRSAVPMLLMAAALVLSRVIVGPRAESRGTLGRAAIFWAGLMAGVLLLGTVVTEHYGTRLIIEAELVSTQLALSLKKVLEYPLFFGAAAAAALIAVEMAVIAARLKWGRKARSITCGILRPVCIAGIVLVAANLAASMVVDLPHLRSTANPADDATTAYLGRAAATLLTPFRLRNHDFEASTTFWGAFGWVDAILPGWMLSLLVGATALALIVTLAGLWRSKDAGSFFRVTAAGAGVIATLIAYAAAGLWTWTPVVLHGRYLIGVYVVGLVAMWSPILHGAGDGSTTPVWLGSFCWTLLGMAHCVALITILQRYF